MDNKKYEALSLKTECLNTLTEYIPAAVLLVLLYLCSMFLLGAYLYALHPARNAITLLQFIVLGFNMISAAYCGGSSLHSASLKINSTTKNSTIYAIYDLLTRRVFYGVVSILITIGLMIVIG